jgi:hypothetical protein
MRVPSEAGARRLTQNGLGIPASGISVPVPEHFGTGLGPLIPIPDWAPLFWYWNSSGIVIFAHSGAGVPDFLDSPAFWPFKNALQW